LETVLETDTAPVWIQRGPTHYTVSPERGPLSRGPRAPEPLTD